MNKPITIPEQSPIPGGVWTVASIADASALRALSRITVPDHCDILELRADGWPELADEAPGLLAGAGVPLLLTVRSKAEGGLQLMEDTARRSLIRSLLPVATLLDMEIASLDSMQDVCAEARERGVLLVASAHDFSGTPPLEIMQEKISRARTAGANIVKFAVTLRSASDLHSLTTLLETPGHGPLSLMGMGRLGPVSRLLCAQLGSVLNYGYLDRATVPGQWPAARLRDMIRELRA